MVEDVGFLASWAVWRDAVAVSVVAASALSMLGVWIVSRRVVFLPLVLSQVSSAGVVCAFLVGDMFFSGVPAPWYLDPVMAAFMFSGLASVWFAVTGRSSGNATALAYLFAAAATMILGGFVRSDVHDIAGLLFGNAVIVEPRQAFWVGGAALIVGIVQLLFGRRLLVTGFDADFAAASGINVKKYEVLLFLTMAMMISVSTRAVGALPTFSFAVIPAMTGLRLARTIRQAMWLAVISGLVSAISGYVLSFKFDLPTGACMVAVSGALYAFAAAVGLIDVLRRNFSARRT